MDTFKKSRILIVDDDQEELNVFEEYLTKEGFPVVRVESGAEAVQMVSNEPFALVILDLVLPGMDGMEALCQIKRVNQRLPVIMITAYHDLEKASQAFHLGAHDYIFKPVDFKYLRRIIRNLLQV